MGVVALQKSVQKIKQEMARLLDSPSPRGEDAKDDSDVDFFERQVNQQSDEE